MNKKRNQYVYHLVGVITKKTKQLPKTGQYLGTYYYNLAVKIENKPTIQSIKVFPNSLENKSLWKALATNKYLGKRYILHCRNWKGVYYLISWEELKTSNKCFSYAN